MRAKKPLIAITASGRYLQPQRPELRHLVLSADYARSVALAGGIPVIAAEECPEEIAQVCDGLLLSGGADLAPKLYEGTEADGVIPDLVRDSYEGMLLGAWLKTGKPVFGICRGCQFINVYFGGSLYQDLEKEDGWSHKDWDVRHRVLAKNGSIVERLFGREFLVNTIHHQAVKEPGRGFKVTARSPKGIVEALEHESLPIFATQFHPEKMANGSNDGSTQDFQPVFRYFVELAGKHGRELGLTEEFLPQEAAERRML